MLAIYSAHSLPSLSHHIVKRVEDNLERETSFSLRQIGLIFSDTTCKKCNFSQ
jgi:hypothetical protein